MVSSVIGGFQKISKKREKSREEMDLVHARKYKKPVRVDKRPNRIGKRDQVDPFQIQDSRSKDIVEEFDYDFEH